MTFLLHHFEFVMLNTATMTGIANLFENCNLVPWKRKGPGNEVAKTAGSMNPEKRGLIFSNSGW